MQNVIRKLTGTRLQDRCSTTAPTISTRHSRFHLAFKSIFNFWVIKLHPFLLSALQLIHHQVQLAAWVWRRERVSHFSCTFLFQSCAVALCYYYYRADPEQVSTQTIIQPAQPQHHPICVLPSNHIAPRSQITSHYVLQTISLMCLAHPFASEKQHHMPSSHRLRSLHTPQVAHSPKAHKSTRYG